MERMEEGTGLEARDAFGTFTGGSSSESTTLSAAFPFDDLGFGSFGGTREHLTLDREQTEHRQVGC